MKLICENSNSLHINAKGVHGDATDTIGAVGHSFPYILLLSQSKKHFLLFVACTRKLNERKVHRASLGYHGNIALKQNGGQDKYSYFYNIFGLGASRIAYYRLSYTNY